MRVDLNACGPATEKAKLGAHLASMKVAVCRRPKIKSRFKPKMFFEVETLAYEVEKPAAWRTCHHLLFIMLRLSS